MKRTLSLVLALVMVLGSFSAVFAAEPTVEETAGAFLKDKEVLKGDASGDLMLEEGLKRQDAVILISKLMGDFETAKEFPMVAPYNDVKDNFYVPFLGWAYGNGTFVGKGEGKFGFDELLTAQEYASVLLRVLGYEVKWDDTLEEAEKLGLLADIDVDAEFLRGQMAVMTVNALKAEMKDEKTTLAEYLNIEMPVVEPEVPAALELVGIKADNLKEVEVTFNQKVDKVSAENKDNYKLATGTVDTAVLLEDGMTVRLTLVSSIANQRVNKISIKNVKAGDLKLVEVKDREFTPVDNTLPKVEEVIALGTKAIKVVFNEPIKTAAVASFKLNGKAFYGYPTISSRVVTLKPYDASALSVGSHVLTVGGVEDYFGLKALSGEFAFEVVEDKVAPTMTEVEATLEVLTVTFSEDIDPDTVDANKVYWKSGDSKVTATGKKALAGNKYEFYFSGTGKALPSYETSIFVEGVKDYSGNEMTETTKLVRATVDQTRPEVVEIKVNNDKKGFVIKFNKTIKNEANGYNAFITVTDKDGKVRSIDNSVRNSTRTNEIDVNLYAALPQGTNKVKVSGIKDATILENTMLDYVQEITLGDTTAPKYSSHSIAYNAAQGVRRVIIAFNEKMDPATIANPSNYIITYNGVERVLPSDVVLSVIQDSKAILLDFPDKMGNDDFVFGGAGLTLVKVMGVKDVAGNVLDGFVKSITITASQTVNLANYYSDVNNNQKAAVTGFKQLKVKFDQGIAKAEISDFTVAAPYTIASVVADNSNVVTINLNEALATSDTKPMITVIGTTIQTVAGQIGIGRAPITINQVDIIDELAPRVKLLAAPAITTFPVVAGTPSGHMISVPFTEVLAGDAVAGTGVDSFYAQDFIVTRDSDGKVLNPNTDYSTNLNLLDNSIVEITVTNNLAANGKYRVAVKSGAKYIQDLESYDENYALAQSELFAVVAAANSSNLATDLAATNITYAAGETATTVKTNLTLVQGVAGSVYTWTSSDPAVVSNTGTVTRPAYNVGDKTVTLTATLVNGPLTATKSFTVTVLKKDFTVEGAATPNLTFTITGDGYAPTDFVLGDIDMDSANPGNDSAVLVNGVTYTVSYAAGTATVALTGTTTGPDAATTRTITVAKDGKVLTLTLTIPAATSAGEIPAATIN